MASPSYGIDAVALALAVLLAVAIAFLISQIIPPLADLMMRSAREADRLVLPALLKNARPVARAN
jgi:hypothetical protein